MMERSNRGVSFCNMTESKRHSVLSYQRKMTDVCRSENDANTAIDKHNRGGNDGNTLLHCISTNKFQLMRRINKQLVIDKDLRKTKHDVQVSIDDCTIAMRKLRVYEFRLDQLKQGSVRRTGNREIDSEINSLSTRKIQINMIKCSNCGNNISKRLLLSHSRICKSNKVNHPICLSSSFNCLMEPQPPRNLSVNKAGHNFIDISWEDPVLNGGCKVYDFDISFQENIYRNVGKRKVFVETVDHLFSSLSCWCLKHPLPANSFVLTGLKANTEYSNFKIRCRNEIGFSLYSPPLKLPTSTEGKFLYIFEFMSVKLIL